MNESKMLAEIMLQLSIYFESDTDDIAEWLSFENLNFGGCSPMQLIKLGKIKKLHNFVMEEMQ